MKLTGEDKGELDVVVTKGDAVIKVYSIKTNGTPDIGVDNRHLQTIKTGLSATGAQKQQLKCANQQNDDLTKLSIILTGTASLVPTIWKGLKADLNQAVLDSIQREIDAHNKSIKADRAASPAAATLGALATKLKDRQGQDIKKLGKQISGWEKMTAKAPQNFRDKTKVEIETLLTKVGSDLSPAEGELIRTQLKKFDS